MGMSKRQKTNEDVHDTANKRTYCEEESTDVSMRGIMLTAASPPIMNMVEISDTISDFEPEKTDVEGAEMMIQNAAKIYKSKRKRKKKKGLKRKQKKPVTDSSMESTKHSHEELCHKKSLNKQESTRNSSGHS